MYLHNVQVTSQRTSPKSDEGTCACTFSYSHACVCVFSCVCVFCLHACTYIQCVGDKATDKSEVCSNQKSDEGTCACMHSLTLTCMSMCFCVWVFCLHIGVGTGGVLGARAPPSFYVVNAHNSRVVSNTYCSRVVSNKCEIAAETYTVYIFITHWQCLKRQIHHSVRHQKKSKKQATLLGMLD